VAACSLALAARLVRTRLRRNYSMTNPSRVLLAENPRQPVGKGNSTRWIWSERPRGQTIGPRPCHHESLALLSILIRHASTHRRLPRSRPIHGCWRGAKDGGRGAGGEGRSAGDASDASPVAQDFSSRLARPRWQQRSTSPTCPPALTAQHARMTDASLLTRAKWGAMAKRHRRIRRSSTM